MMAKYEVGDSFRDFTGPLGCKSELIDEPIEELKKKKILFVAGGVGTAPVYPQVKWMKSQGCEVDCPPNDHQILDHLHRQILPVPLLSIYMLHTFLFIPVREQDPQIRAKNFEEVCLGYNKEEAMEEATRCLKCKNPQCQKGCPVGIECVRPQLHEKLQFKYGSIDRLCILFLCFLSFHPLPLIYYTCVNYNVQ